MRPVHALVRSTVYIPRSLLPEKISGVLPSIFTAKHFNAETHETTDISLYKETKHGFYLPRAWVRDNLPTVWKSALDGTTEPRVDPSAYPADPITPRDAEQAAFMLGMKNLALSGVVDAQVEASTGTGKTVTILKTICDIGITNALVIVHRNNLKDQWVGNIRLKKGMKYFFGEDWVEENVGIIQQDTFDFGKPVTVAMAPTLCYRKYPKEFYDYFGAIFVDEDHRFATPMLQRIMSMFKAKVRIGVTATRKQGDIAKVVDYHLGGSQLVSKQEAMQPKVIRIKYKHEVNFYNYAGPESPLENVKSCDTSRMLAVFIPKIKDRNDLIANIVYERAYMKGRYGLILGSRVEHLREIMERVIALGAERGDCGFYVGQHKTGKYKLTGKSVAGDNVVHFRGLPPFETIAKAKSYAKKALPGGTLLINVKPWVHTITSEERTHIEENCKLIFATYGIFSDGTDISRLDWGMEISLVGDVTQAVGRILRIDKQKATPVWYAFEDTLIQNVNMIGDNVLHYEYGTPKRLAKSRMQSYKKQNAIISVIGNPRNALDKAKAC